MASSTAISGEFHSSCLEQPGEKEIDELFIDTDDAYKPMSASAKEICRNEGNMKAFKICGPSQKVQYQNSNK